MKISHRIFTLLLGVYVFALTSTLCAEKALPSSTTIMPQQSPKNKGKFKEKMLKKFDKNGDGKLDEQEKNEMKAFLKEKKEKRHKKNVGKI